MTGGCILAIAAGCLSIGALAEQDPRYLLGTLVLGLLATLILTLYNNLSDTVVIDFEELVVEEIRTFRGRRVRTRATPFLGVHCVFVEAQRERSERNGPVRWTYGLALALAKGGKLRLTHLDEPSHESARGAGERLAERLGVGFFPGRMERMVILQGKNPPELSLKEPD